MDSKNIPKGDNYSLQIKKLARAMRGKFYLEAIFIEFAILEDRTSSLLRHLNMKRKSKLMFNPKIKVLKEVANYTDYKINSYKLGELLIEIDKWRLDRNKYVHSLVRNNTYSEEELEDCAQTGKQLVKNFSRKVRLINDRIDRAKNNKSKV